MKTKLFHLIFGVGLFLLGQAAQGQTLQQFIDRNLNKVFPHMSIVTDALSPELSIIRQQYQLEREGDHWGKNGKNYYGENYTLGVKVAGGIIFLGDVLTPWKNDADYQKRNAVGNYTPVLYRSYQRGINEGIFQEVELDLDSYAKPLNGDKSLYINADARKDFGLNIDESTGEKKGYMIWAYSTTTLQDSAMLVNFVQNSYQVEATAESTIYSMTPDNQERLLGGIFVVPKVERGGRVQFLLVGVAAPDADKKWNLHLLTTEANPLPKEIADKRKKKDDKKKEEEPNDSELTPIK